MAKKIHLIVDDKQSTQNYENIIEYLHTHYTITATVHEYHDLFDQFDEDHLFLLYLGDEQIKIFFTNHVNTKVSIAILPHEKCITAMKNYGISKNLNEAIDDAFNPELLSKIDLLKCNEHFAFNTIIIGHMHGMNQIDFEQFSRWHKIKLFFENLKHLNFKSYTLTTSKDHTIQTAASGMMVLEHTIVCERSAISDELSIHDGKLNAFVLAPRSLLSYLWYLILIFYYQKISSASLPPSVGFIKTTQLVIGSSSAIEYKMDSNLLSAKEIHLEVWQDCLNIHLGRTLLQSVRNDENRLEVKDTIKLNSLPNGEISSILIGGKLPLFTKASDDDFKELFSNLRNSAKFSYVFLTLMILSTLLAVTGLFANSAPVIIGAMILAPLMAPIISLSMGVIRADKFLLEQSVRTLGIGIGMALLFSFLFTLMIPLEQITPEMQSRLHPTLLDMMVAILSGMAGAYASSKEEIAKSLAGVAIAVALVPPLGVTGIGIGLWDFEVIYGSFLLFTTNLVGITLSAAFTFMVLGYSPVTKAKKGIIYSAILMSIVAIPLLISFSKIVERNDYFNQLKTMSSVTLNEQRIELNALQIRDKNNIVWIELEVISSKTLSYETLQKIKHLIQKRIDKNVQLQVVSKIVIK
ncbi:MAG: TIGR00341 family protein [Campylobacterota bacterium]|nr:TIGR00341 family protein [Campylobacterota bacterium]